MLVVDGMSEDGTREALFGLKDIYPTLKIIDNPHRLTPFAFNLGVVHSQGEFIQIVGSRNILAPDYLAILVAKLRSLPDVGCVGGDYQHVYDDQKGKSLALAMESKFGVGGSNYRTMQHDTEVDTVGVPMYRRTIFCQVGLFDEDLTRNQDDEYNFRVRNAGWRIFYVHSAKVTYLVRSDLRKAFKQFFQYGYFKVLVNRKHGTVTTFRQLIPAGFVVFLLLWPIMSIVFGEEAFLAGGVIVILYAIAGTILAGRQLTFKDRVKVLWACFTLHVAYGLGYLQGVVDFLFLNRGPRQFFQRQTV